MKASPRRCGTFLMAVALCLGIGGTALARGKGGGAKVWVEPERAEAENPDFLVQGEYSNGRGGSTRCVSRAVFRARDGTPSA